MRYFQTVGKIGWVEKIPGFKAYIFNSNYVLLGCSHAFDCRCRFSILLAAVTFFQGASAGLVICTNCSKCTSDLLFNYLIDAFFIGLSVSY